jgi:uncharacterized repeat protein (TIGR03833 family)
MDLAKSLDYWVINFYVKQKVDIIVNSWNMNGMNRSNIKTGLKVRIVLKQDQKSGKLTEGVVRDILTKSPSHPHGIKVRLTSGEVGRVKEICI